jgi:hypothetical protein
MLWIVFINIQKNYKQILNNYDSSNKILTYLGSTRIISEDLFSNTKPLSSQQPSILL